MRPGARAELRFDVVVIEEGHGGEKFEIRIPKRVEIRDSTKISKKFTCKLRKGNVEDA